MNIVLKKNTRSSDFWKLPILVIVVLASLAGLRVWQRVRVDVLYRQIGVLEKRLNEMEHNNAQLNSKLEKLRDFQRISKIAREDLGLVFPEKRVLRLNEKQANLIQKK